MSSGSVRSQFQVQVKKDGDSMEVRIAGPIDESSILPDLAGIERGLLSLHLDGITRVNSMGLRKWILWLKGLPKSVQLEFYNCPRVVADQMGVLEGFLPISARVMSFQVPYYCENCGHEEIQLAKREIDYLEATADFKEKVLLASTRTCPKCSKSMEWDIIPSRYFSFLRRRR